MRISIDIEDAFLHELAASLGKPLGRGAGAASPEAIAIEALAAYEWMARKASEGCEVVARDANGPRERIATPLLSAIRR